MSLKITRQGIFDTVQDAGRYGFQHLGINPGGAADAVAYSVANMLVGNECGEAVIEMHFPASSMVFQQDALIALTGADFSASINGRAIPIHEPIVVAANTTIEFTHWVSGYRCYLAVKGGFKINQWLGSYSTNVKARAGGHNGRRLLTGDIILFNNAIDFSSPLKSKSYLLLGWRADVLPLYWQRSIMRICSGNEYSLLSPASKNVLTNSIFTITNETDRMGCRLSGIPLQQSSDIEMVSSGITSGTIQLLPNGQLIVLMADHQTAGGYPRIAHIADIDMPALAQMCPGQMICFRWIDTADAEEYLIHQHSYLLQLQDACNLRLDEFLSAHAQHRP